LPGNFCQGEQEKEENVKEREKSTKKGKTYPEAVKKAKKCMRSIYWHIVEEKNMYLL
jgi:hypothetical protein